MNLKHLNFPVPFHETMEYMDSTKIQAYQDCPRMFFFEYILGWRSIRPNNHLHFGSCLHNAMEHIILNGYGSDSIREALVMFDNEYRETFPADTDALFFPKTPERFLQMLIQYIQKYHDDFENYRVIKTEIAGTVPLSPHHEMIFKMDTILQEIKSGMYFSLEHKSKGGYITDTYRYEFMNSTQVGTYTHVLNCLFEPSEVRGVMINCMAFLKNKGTRGGQKFALERIPVYRNNDQMQTWLTSTCGWLDEIENDYKLLSQCTPDDRTLPAFKLNGRGCTNWNRLCTYFDYCTAWPNPLRRCGEPPIGLQVDFWDPTAQPTVTETIDLSGVVR